MPGSSAAAGLAECEAKAGTAQAKATSRRTPARLPRGVDLPPHRILVTRIVGKRIALFLSTAGKHASKREP
jgi:hypothetical protein